MEGKDTKSPCVACEVFPHPFQFSCSCFRKNTKGGAGYGGNKKINLRSSPISSSFAGNRSARSEISEKAIRGVAHRQREKKYRGTAIKKVEVFFFVSLRFREVARRVLSEAKITHPRYEEVP